MAYLYPATNILIDKLHHLARIEAIGLTEVDKQTLIAFLGLARTSLSASCPLLLALCPLFLASCPLLLAPCPRSRFLYLRCVVIVLKEATEGETYYLLDNVLLVVVFEVAHDILHERSNLFLIYINLTYLVDSLI